LSVAWSPVVLAEIEGKGALISDLRTRLYMTTDEAKAAYESAPEWLRQLCDAFADGVNWYLYTHPNVKPRLFTRFEPWMPMFFSEGSIGGDIEQIPLEGIDAFYNREGETAYASTDHGRIECAAAGRRHGRARVQGRVPTQPIAKIAPQTGARSPPRRGQYV